MTTPKTTFVDQLNEGDRFEEVFLVKTVRLLETRAGKPYLNLVVMDKTGEIGGPVWENARELHAYCETGKFVRIKGAVQSYRDNLQLKVDSLKGADASGIDESQFVIASSHDIEDMADEIHALVRSIDSQPLKQLLKEFFFKGDLWKNFKTAPAAKSIHHGYLGGLMEHSLSVARLADTMAQHYQGVDRSLLVAGALLHDIGKLKELEMKVGAIEYTNTGRLKGHLVIGSEMVASAALRIKDFPEEILEQLQHLVLSHHGRQEFGSPTVPMTLEAFILSFLDDLDAKVNQIDQLRSKLTSDEKQWSDYQRTLERYLFINRIKDEVKDCAVSDNGAERQLSLFNKL